VIASLLLLGLSFGGLSVDAAAQETIVWSDIDCAQSKLVVPAGLRCRETNEVGTRGRATSTGGGVTKRWAAFGTQQQVRLYYYVHEVLSMRSFVQVGQFTDVLRGTSPEAKGASHMSQPTARNGVDLVTFASARGENCIGLRRLGPSAAKGVAWVLYATRCAPAGRKATDAEIDGFIAAADFRP
jgi:hypothetical protein